jgi:hypothetical protein
MLSVNNIEVLYDRRPILQVRSMRTWPAAPA